MKKLFAFTLCGASLWAATPAEKAMEQARSSISRDAQRPDGYNQLAIALARRARESADPSYYDQALKALERSFAAGPGNFEGLKAKTWVLLGKHQFSAALDLAKSLNKRAPDDLLVYGFLTDAYMELGNYSEAEKAAQWMLDLRPGNIPGLTRGAYLREVFGDIEGAIDFMSQALHRMRPEETEDRAWVLTHIAHLHLVRGRVDHAERALTSALKIFPDYHYALGNLAKLRQAQRKYGDAVDLYRKRYEVAPHPENLYDVGVALAQAGRSSEAKAAFRAFDKDARKEMAGPDNSNRELALYYLEYAHRPEEALRIAEREVSQKQDVLTLDAYAWALHKNGRGADAKAVIDRVLAVGFTDSQVLYHAGVIAHALKDSQRASALLAKALANNPAFPAADDAKRLLKVR